MPAEQNGVGQGLLTSLETFAWSVGETPLRYCGDPVLRVVDFDRGRGRHRHIRRLQDLGEVDVDLVLDLVGDDLALGVELRAAELERVGGRAVGAVEREPALEEDRRREERGLRGPRRWFV